MKKSLDWPSRYAEFKTRFEGAATDAERFAFLPTLAKGAFELGEVNEAEGRALGLLALAVTLPDNWNYGNAIHDGHSVLGRVALAKGDLAAAKEHLLQAGRTPGSPQLNSFGPNVSLARDLLARGEVSIVVEYFRLCEAFWEMESGRIAHWSQVAESGEMPEFGPNLVY
jgi:hypothetical protein